MSELNELAAAASEVKPVQRGPTIPVADTSERLAVSSIDSLVIFGIAMALFVLSGRRGREFLGWAGEVWLLGHLAIESITGFTVGSKLVKLRVAGPGGEPIKRIRLAVRGLVRHAWLWLMFVLTLMDLLAVRHSESESVANIYSGLQFAMLGTWLAMTAGSLIGLRESSRTLADVITGTFVLSDRRIALSKARMRTQSAPVV